MGLEDINLALFTDLLAWEFGPNPPREPDPRDVSDCKKLAEFLAERIDMRQRPAPSEFQRSVAYALSERFDISVFTALSWLTGDSAPVPEIRPLVLATLGGGNVR